MQLHGKRAIVTGGAVRLGKAIALALAEQGVDVGLHYFESTAAADETCREIRELGSKVVAIRTDLSEPAAAAKTIVDEMTSALGPSDILVNNAAIFPEGRLAALTPEDWERTMAINLAAPTFLSREFVARLTPGRPAHIVNIVDWRAARTDPSHLVYTLTKSGLAALTRNLALDLAPHVQVNALAPGAILPPPGEDDEFLQQAAERIPLRRSGSPADVAAALLYLLGSDFITGEVLHVAGGQQI